MAKSRSGLESTPKTSTAQHPWPLNVIVQELPIIKAAPISFAICVLASGVLSFLGIFWLVNQMYSAEVRGKNAELQQKAETIRTISEERDRANRDSEKLSKQVEGMRIYRAQDAPPLKKKAFILAEQIRDFTKSWKDTDPQNVQFDNVQKYQQRFGLRAAIMRDDLDQSGQHSDTFDKAMDNFTMKYGEVQTIATEIEKLASHLSD